MEKLNVQLPITFEEFFVKNMFKESLNYGYTYYRSRFAHYQAKQFKESLKEIMSEAPEYIMKDFVTNYECLKRIQLEVLKKEFPQEGDVIFFKNKGIFEHDSISVRPWQDKDGLWYFQGGSSDYHYRDEQGNSSYSGTCGDLFKVKKFVKTGFYLDRNCWFFNKFWAGGGRGLDGKIFVPVYTASIV